MSTPILPRAVLFTTLLTATLAAQTSPACLTIGNNPPGTKLPMGEDSKYVLPLRFDFPFAGTNYNTITVNSNGYVELGSRPGFSDFTPTEGELLSGAPRICLFWDDWAPQENNSPNSGIFFKDSATAAHIIFKDVPYFVVAPLTGNVFSGEMILTPAGEIYLHIGAATTSPEVNGFVGLTAGGGVAANPLDLSGLPTFAGSTGYENFSSPAPGNPLDLLNTTIKFTPDPLVPGSYSLTSAALPACAPTPNPPVASSSSYGIGCPSPNAGYYYQEFPAGTLDLSGLSIRFAATGTSTYDVVPGPGLDNSFTPADAFIIDDDQVVVQQLGFTFNFNGTNHTAIGLSSNGFLWMNTVSTDPQFTNSLNGLLTQPARIAPLWDDLDPDFAGTVYWTQGAGFAMATYENVPYFGVPGGNTFQCKLYANGDIEFNYGALTPNIDSSTVGLSGGPGGVDLGPTDISTLTGQVNLGAGVQPLTLTSTQPSIGSIYTLTYTDLPPNTVDLLTGLGFESLQIDLTPAGMPGCEQLMNPLVFLFAAPPPGAVTHQEFIPIPPDAAFLGLPLLSQGFAVAPGINFLGAATSNGRIGTIGF
ncbi:MAG: hypothetical protein VYE77_06095 [Planctomycetota bacterium]|nr:hypothetical protein [Planctomycetota bacterium]